MAARDNANAPEKQAGHARRRPSPVGISGVVRSPASRQPTRAMTADARRQQPLPAPGHASAIAATTRSERAREPGAGAQLLQRWRWAKRLFAARRIRRQSPSDPRRTRPRWMPKLVQTASSGWHSNAARTYTTHEICAPRGGQRLERDLGCSAVRGGKPGACSRQGLGHGRSPLSERCSSPSRAIIDGQAQSAGAARPPACRSRRLLARAELVRAAAG